MIDTMRVRERSEELYRTGQFLCSEAIVHTINEALGSPMPQEAVKMASGFPVGMGDLVHGGCTCGALAGGVMALGIVFGRSDPGDEAPLILDKAKQLHDWFLAEKGSTCCRALIRDLEFGSTEHIDQCVAFTGDVAECVAEMIDAV